MITIDLSGQVAVITGGSRGIGRTAVQIFAQAGAIVHIWDMDDLAGKAAAAALTEQGHKVFFQKVDTSKPEETERATRLAIQQSKRIDILVNNAGITRDASLLKMSYEQWQQVIDVNLTGVFNCTKAVAPVMVEQGNGRIINTASVVALYGNFGQTNYVASKSGVIGMTKVWARELARKGITVNAVAPGFIQTEMTAKIPAEHLAAINTRIPVGQMGQPEDIANAYLFLASPLARYINGEVLSVDGGMTI